MAFLNREGLVHLWSHIVARLGTKVDVENGKGLSTNDYTNEDKNKLNSMSGDVDTLKSLVGNTAVSEQIDGKINSHNISTESHNDIRGLITDLTSRLNALADSDDTTLDQLSEIVAYIKSNKELIDAVTTSKVNVSDIVNDLETNVTNKPLSAAQGVAIKALIDDLQASAGSIEFITVDYIDNLCENEIEYAGVNEVTF